MGAFSPLLITEVALLDCAQHLGLFLIHFHCRCMNTPVFHLLYFLLLHMLPAAETRLGVDEKQITVPRLVNAHINPARVPYIWKK